MKKLFTRFYFLVPLSVLLIIVIFSACQDTSTNPQVKYNVSGIIKDEQGNGVPMALIQAFTNSTQIISSDTTDENGKFTLTAIPENFESVTVKISHSDFKPYQSNMKEIIGGGDKSNTQIELFHEDSCKGLIQFYIRNKADNKAMSNVEVRLNRGSDIIRKGNTGDDGKILFEYVCEGDYNYRIAKDGYRTQELEFKFNGTDTLKKEIFLLSNNEPPPDSCCNGLVTILVRDSSEKIISGVSVYVYKNGTKIKSETTNGDGAVTLRAMCEGEYSVSMTKDGWKGQEFSFKLTCDDTVSYKKTLYTEPKDSCCDAVLKLCLKNANNEAINGALVKVRINGVVIKDGKTENGCIKFTNLCAANYSLMITADGYNALEYNLELKCHDTIEASKQLVATPSDSCCDAVLKVCLKNADNVAINGALVKVRINGVLIKDGKTENGCIKFTNLCAANYSLMITADGYNALEYNLALKCHDTIEASKQLVATTSDSCCDAVLKVCLKNADNVAINGALVKVRINGVVIKDGKTENGCIKFTNLCAANYSLMITADGYNALEYNLALKCHDTLEASKQLVATPSDSCCDAVLKVCLKNVDNVAINGALVKVRINGVVIKDGKTENGCIKFTNLCAANYSLMITADGYNALEYNLALKCHDTIEASKQLVATPKDSCCDAVLKVCLKNSGNESISGATVKVRINGVVITYGNTENGCISFKNLCAADYSLYITRDGYKALEYNLTLKCHDTIEVSKQLEFLNQDTCCKGIVKVYVTDKNTGEPVSGPTVKIWKSGVVYRYAALKDGWAVMDGICKGEYSVSIPSDKYNTVEFTFSIECNETKTMEKTLELKDTCCNGKMYIRPKDPNTSETINGAKVVVTLNGIEIGTKYVENGNAIYEKLCQGTYVIHVYMDGYKTLEFSYELSCNDAKEVEKYMVKNTVDTCYTAKLKLTVIDTATLEPISGATVVIKIGDDVYKDGTTNGDGIVGWETLKAPITYRVIISKDGYVTRTVEYTYVECNSKTEAIKLEK